MLSKCTGSQVEGQEGAERPRWPHRVEGNIKVFRADMNCPATNIQLVTWAHQRPGRRLRTE